MKKIFSTIALFTLLVGPITAQESSFHSYVIANDGSRIEAKIKSDYVNNEKNFSFYDQEGNQIDSGDIIAFFPSEGLKYVKDSRFNGFIRVVLEGKLSLFEKGNAFFLKNKLDSVYLLENKYDTIKSDGRTFVKRSNKWKAVLNFLAKDCSKELALPESYSEKNITQYLVKYHKCIDEEYTLIDDFSPWRSLDIGLVGSYQINKVNIDQASETFRYYEDEFASNGFMFGLNFHLYLPKYDKRLGFTSGLQLSQIKYNSVLNTQIPDDIDYITEVNQLNLGVPLLLNYKLVANKSIELQASAGIQLNILLMNDFSTIVQNNSQNSTNQLDSEFKLDVNAVNFALQSKLSLIKYIGDSKIGVFSKIVFTPSYGTGIYNNSDQYSASSTFSNFGIEFMW